MSTPFQPDQTVTLRSLSDHRAAANRALRRLLNLAADPTRQAQLGPEPIVDITEQIRWRVSEMKLLIRQLRVANGRHYGRGAPQSVTWTWPWRLLTLLLLAAITSFPAISILGMYLIKFPAASAVIYLAALMLMYDAYPFARPFDDHRPYAAVEWRLNAVEQMIDHGTLHTATYKSVEIPLLSTGESL